MKIKDSRREYGTSIVYVEDGAVITANSMSTGTETTGQVENYWVDDEHTPGQWWMEVRATVVPFKKDGTPMARSITVNAPRKDVPAEVKQALAEQRPEIKDWLNA